LVSIILPVARDCKYKGQAGQGAVAERITMGTPKRTVLILIWAYRLSSSETKYFITTITAGAVTSSKGPAWTAAGSQ